MKSANMIKWIFSFVMVNALLFISSCMDEPSNALTIVHVDVGYYEPYTHYQVSFSVDTTFNKHPCIIWGLSAGGCWKSENILIRLSLMENEDHKLYADAIKQRPEEVLNDLYNGLSEIVEIAELKKINTDIIKGYAGVIHENKEKCYVYDGIYRNDKRVRLGLEVTAPNDNVKVDMKYLNAIIKSIEINKKE